LIGKILPSRSSADQPDRTKPLPGLDFGAVDQRDDESEHVELPSFLAPLTVHAVI
jgi:hypothetical protein